MAVPRWKYRFSRAVHRERTDINAMLRDWHRAMLLGLELETVEMNGVPLDPRRVMMINLWVSAWGSWRASRQDFFEAWRRLESIIETEAIRPSRKRRRIQ